jgi:serine/threonine protein kinase
MPTKAPLVLEWMAIFGDVPEEWRKQANVVVGDCKDDIDGTSLLSWLCETYFSSERGAEFAEEDVKRLRDLLTKLMCSLPRDRLSAQDILKHEWFAKNQEP